MKCFHQNVITSSLSDNLVSLQINVAEGLELFEDVLDVYEASKLAILISDLPAFGRRGKYEHVATLFLVDPVLNVRTLY